MKTLVVEFPEFKELQSLTQLDLARDWDGCKLCKELVRSRSQIVHGSGNTKAHLMILGGAPGNAEDYEGVPFIGDCGCLLNSLLVLNDLARKDVFVDNLIPCLPLDSGPRPSVRVPTRKEVTNCLPRVYETIRQVDPLLIVAMGRPVLHALTKDTTMTITKARGSVHLVRIPGVFKMIEYPIVVSQHPSYVLEKPSRAGKYSSEWYLARDFVFAVQLINLARKCYGR